jgi:hypothetical protein
MDGEENEEKSFFSESFLEYNLPHTTASDSLDGIHPSPYF